jgi:hypothetical protein
MNETEWAKATLELLGDDDGAKALATFLLERSTQHWHGEDVTTREWLMASALDYARRQASK